MGTGTRTRTGKGDRDLLSLQSLFSEVLFFWGFVSAVGADKASYPMANNQAVTQGSMVGPGNRQAACRYL